MFDLLVFIGRFQPFHNEHKRTLDTALEMSKEVLVLIGSSNQASTPKNPFTYDQRADVILECYKPGTNLWVDSLNDFPNDDDRWAEQVLGKIRNAALHIANDGGFRNHGINGMKIGIIGAKKDDSSFYLDMFPDLELVEIDLTHMIHATDIRLSYFGERVIEYSLIPKPVALFLENFINTKKFDYLEEWQAVIDHDKYIWSKSPYPVKQVTADAVVTHKDRVLLVKRGKHPGKGLWALPGGHVNVGERVTHAAVRELEEETGLKLSEDYILERKVFDDPNRSTMGHAITHAALMDISYEYPEEAPEVRGADDAIEAKWFSLCDITSEMMHDDHYHIIQDFWGE